MRNLLLFGGGSLFALGMLLATGAEYNWKQGLVAIVLMGVGALCFNRADKDERKLFSRDKKHTIEKWEEAA